MTRGPLWSKQEDMVVLKAMREEPGVSCWTLANKLARLIPNRTIKSIDSRIKRLRHEIDVGLELNPKAETPNLDGRPLMQMLKVLWDMRQAPDEKLRKLYIQAAGVVEAVYCDIAKARADMEKMRPAYQREIEAEERRIQQRMDDIAEAVKTNFLVDKELKG